MFNSNNYGYNPYGRYIPQQAMDQMQQPISTFNQIQQKQVLNGKQVESIEVVKAMDIPMDGSISYFPIADGSAIISKQMQMDGTSKTIIYKQVSETNKNNPKYVTNEELEERITKIDLSEIDDLKDELKDIKKTIKELKKKKSD